MSAFIDPPRLPVIDLSPLEGGGHWRDAHTDRGLITLVYQDEVGGLQVKHGPSWIDVPPVPGSFVVTVGDILEKLTHGRYVPAVHRVIHFARIYAEVRPG